ncbi:hypothetical protein FSP39_012287 [Pinctada imbricata]|uniref:C2H2-type domain-containing protein n=1 Tax=Pinctada imbricata TaxID=66713 RepID=A0AA88YBE5_PINIB|nr:hypothetical protein FSP39_012287 [Pinctada imbricata]
MPKGFLVKRTNNPAAVSYRIRRNSEDRGDGSLEQDAIVTRFGSPDSGYSASPVNFVIKDSEDNNQEKNFVTIERPPSPLTVSTTSQPSPFYYSSFDKLRVSTNSPSHENLSPNIHQKQESGQSLNSPNKRRGVSEVENKIKSPKKPKAARKINFDEDKSSPVSGCIITDIAPDEEGKIIVGDIDSSFNCVEVTPEARAELEKIENKIGDYICQLCKEQYQDAFKLAQHRCSRIIHVEYRCPECDKVFNCPANLASHRRWHKPRPNSTSSKTTVPTRILAANTAVRNLNEALGDEKDPNGNANIKDNGYILSLSARDLRNSPSNEGQYHCETCGKKFRRQAYLRKHVLNHSNALPFSCKFCNKNFANEALKSKHEMQHFNNNVNNNNSVLNNNNNCKSAAFHDGHILNQPSLENSSLRSTIETFPCKYCSSTFCSSPGLTRHINKCHPSENRQVILLQLPPNLNRPM